MDKKDRILIVDDKLENIIIVERMLERVNACFERCASLLQLAEIGDQKSLSLAIVNLNMAEMDGLKVVLDIRESNPTIKLPVIFLSDAVKADDFLIDLYNKELVDLILKPIVPEILSSKVKIFLLLSSYIRGDNERQIVQ